jgi:uncharacterized membrane protein required for colicin V production
MGVILALILATKYMKAGGEYTQGLFKFDAEPSYIVSFAIIFVFVVLLSNFFYRWFGGENKTYAWWNRLAGGLVGIVEGAIVLSLVIILLNLFDMPASEAKRKSSLYKPVSYLAPSLFDQFNKLFPKSKKFKEELYNAIERYKKVEAGAEAPADAE